MIYFPDVLSCFSSSCCKQKTVQTLDVKITVVRGNSQRATVFFQTSQALDVSSYVSQRAAPKLWFVHLWQRLTATGRTSRNHTAITPLRETEVKRGMWGQIFTRQTKISAHLSFSSLSPSFLHHMGLLTPRLINGWRTETRSCQRWTTWLLKERERTEKEKENLKESDSCIHVYAICSRQEKVQILQICSNVYTPALSLTELWANWSCYFILLVQNNQTTTQLDNYTKKSCASTNLMSLLLMLQF